MTKDEAIAVAQAAGQADTGCFRCAVQVCDKLNESKLGWRWQPYVPEEDEMPPETDVIVDVDSYFVISIALEPVEQGLKG